MAHANFPPTRIGLFSVLVQCQSKKKSINVEDWNSFGNLFHLGN